MAVFAYLLTATINAAMIPGYNTIDKIVPMVIGSMGCKLFGRFCRMIRKPEGDVVFADKEVAGDDAEAPHGLWQTLAWLAGLIALTGLLGFILALILFCCPLRSERGCQKHAVWH